MLATLVAVAASGTPTWIVFGGFGIAVAGIVGALFTYAPFAIGAKNKARGEQSDLAINALVGELTAAKYKIERLEEILGDRQKQMDHLQAQFDALKTVVTSRDVIVAGFVALGVPPEKLMADPKDQK